MTLVQQNMTNIIEQVVIDGDLANLSPEQRVAYYRQVCESLGLNPFTKPFDYIVLNAKLQLYARRNCTDQLRRIHDISIEIVSREQAGDLYVVTARASMPTGRSDESTGAVCLANLKGDALANAIMKAETKAKRRVTLSVVGLGWLDETEADSIPDARPVKVSDTGEVQSSLPKRKSETSQQNATESNSPFISEAQRKRLFAITKNNNMKDAQVKQYLQEKYGINSTSQIRKVDYDDVCNWVETAKLVDELEAAGI